MDGTTRAEPDPATHRYRPHRLNTLADGVFAIAMTLLALEIRVPDGVEDGPGFRAALPGLLVAIAVFAAAFFITAQYWVRHHQVMAYVHTVDGTAIGRTVVVLFGVAALPVAAGLVTGYSRYPEAVALAAGVLVLTSLAATRLYAHVLRPEFAEIDPLTRRRTLIAPLFNVAVYLLSVAVAFLLAALAVNSAWAMLTWLLLPLNSAVTSRLAGQSAPVRTQP